ncbi:MAG: hypothetical protein K6E94_00530 [Elusimicrobiaceae bacterium]|nr:hypothetical protein [Elusimicrobiaceae bacterium]
MGDIIPIGTVAKFDEQTRLVQILKTAEVVDIDSDDAKIVSLKVAEFFKPVFCVGDKIAKAGAISGTYANAISITAINKTKSTYVITLSAAISGLAVGDTLEEVVENASHNAAERFTGNSVTIKDVEVDEFETAIDVCADTMQYALLERRVPKIPASQKDAAGMALAGNPHIKLSQSY